MKKINFNMINSLRFFSALILSSILLVQSAIAEEASRYVQNNCASCHALTQPDYESLGFEERINRKAPHLFYSGNKFRKEWLVSWLQKPTRLRPGGSFPPSHTVVTDEGDVIDENTLQTHPVVTAQLAKEIADHLMSLSLNEELINQDNYQPTGVSLMMGRMNFNKFKGCAACHRDNEDMGGVSGPELHTAWLRMQPAFISSYIKNPVAWDPFSMMPQKHLKDKDVNKLVDYLKIISEQK